MMCLRSSGAGLLVLVMQLGCGAAAQEGPKAYSCMFSEGAAFGLEQGVFKGGPTQASLVFDVTDIDMDAQTAKLRFGAREVPVKLVQAISAVHFIEVAGEGYLNLTTIYAVAGNEQSYPAVHSRHFGVLGQPVVSQYRGTCKAKG